MSKVYHGSSIKFKVAKPTYTSRGHLKNGKVIQDYEGISLHSTPYKWIALAYTSKKLNCYIHNGKRQYFGMGAPVKHKDSEFKNKSVMIFGKRSLGYSLNKLYGKGGYLYTFDSSDFIWVKGLGANEVISYEEQVPKEIEFIKDPVKEMLRLGVKFVFVDETKI